MKINWTVRIKNKAFWVTTIPVVLLLIRQVGAMLGFEIDLSALGDQLVGIVETLFILLALLGIVVDPTTPGMEDSARAMTYTKPGKEA